MKVQVREHIQRHRPWDIVRFFYHLPNFVKLFVRLVGDARVSIVPKALLFATVALIVSPLDVLNFIPVVGQLDDLALFALACKFFIQLCPTTLVQEHVSEIDSSGRWAPYS